MWFPNVQRNEEAIVVYLTANDAMPPCPPELRPHISEGDWSYRLSSVNRIVKRSSNPMLERAWFGLAMLVTFISPIIIYHLIFNMVASNSSIGVATKVVELYAIGFAIFLSISFLFWMPLAVWKGIAAIRVRNLMLSFEREDAARQPDAAYRPQWAVHLPGVFGTQARISVALPPPPPLSSFDPSAELPPYIAAYPVNQQGDVLDGKYDPDAHPMGYLDVKQPVNYDDEKTPTPRDFVRIDLEGGRV